MTTQTIPPPPPAAAQRQTTTRAVNPMLQQVLAKKLAELQHTNPKKAKLLEALINPAAASVTSEEISEAIGASQADKATAHAAAALNAAQDVMARIVTLEATVNELLAEVHNQTQLVKRLLNELGSQAD